MDDDDQVERKKENIKKIVIDDLENDLLGDEINPNDFAEETKGESSSASGNFFVNEADRLSQLTLPELERDVIPLEKPNIIQRIVGKKHLDPAVREKKMTSQLEKGKESKREAAADTVTSNAKILVVEDNELVQKVMRSLLATQLGYPNIVFASNGEEGVSVFQSQHPDIIFMDLYMPVMNGGECCAKIRSLPGGANVPIIGVTAHDDKEEMGKFLDNGMNGCLTKPVNAKQLKRVLNRFTGDVAGAAVYTKKNWMEVVHSKKPPPDKARILVVEDNLMIQSVMRSLLKRLKYENVFACNNGKEAITAVSADHYDIIFMDLYMPEMDGVEATAEIRKLKHGANIPIIACTAHAIESDAKLCVDYGMNDLIIKPVSINALVTIFRRFGFQATIKKAKKKESAPPLLRDESFVAMTSLQRQKAISTCEFGDLVNGAPLCQVSQDEDSFTSIRREGAESQFGFPTIHAKEDKGKDEDIVDLTGVRLTTDAFREKKCDKRVPLEHEVGENDDFDTITFTPSAAPENIQSVFRRQSSIFIESVLKKLPDMESDFPEPPADGPIEPFSLQNILSRGDLSNNSKLNLIWKDYLLTEAEGSGEPSDDGILFSLFLFLLFTLLLFGISSSNYVTKWHKRED